MTVEKSKPKQLLRPMTTGADSAMNQSQFLAITFKSLKAREKSRVQGAIGFGFASHWLKSWRESFEPITKHSNRNHAITFDSHLKTALIAVIAVEPAGKASFVLGCMKTRLMSQCNGKWRISLVCVKTAGNYNNSHGAFSHDVTAAILVFQNKETAAMLVYQTKPLGIELHFHANLTFCAMKLTWPLVT